MQYIITSIIALVSGAIGSLLAPWIHWKLEIRKQKRKAKIDLINDLRIYLENNDPKNEHFLNTTNYIKIRPFLSITFLNELEDMSFQTIHVNSVRSYYKDKFLTELEIIEENWKIGIAKKNKKYSGFNHNSKKQVTIEINHDVVNSPTRD
ncbi:hypothetical protein [Flavobacterium sp.]|uniref:hypothetical protein n=1 Tax=Flavobacterium sp. TaxID=239 RepID=UPI0035B430D9